MARVIGGIDYDQYPSWRQVKGASGNVYYVIPGQEGRVYDPYLSGITGKVQVYQNPEQQVSEIDRQRKIQDDQIALQKSQSSLSGQIVPALAGPAGLIAANQLGGGLFGGGSAAGVGGTTAGAGASTGTAASTAFANSAGLGGAPVATGGGNVAAATAPGTGLSSGFAGFGIPAAAAVTTALAGKSAYDMLNGSKTDNSIPGIYGRASLGIATGGLSEAARYLGIGGQDTKEAQVKKWDGLVDKGIKGAAEQQAIQQQVANSDMAGKMIGADGQVKKWNFDEALNQVKSGQSDQFRGVAGNYETFGDNWAGLTPEQQNAVVKGLAGANLYKPDHGNIGISDKTKAQAIFESVVKGGLVPAVTPASGTTPAPIGNNNPAIRPPVKK